MRCALALTVLAAAATGSLLTEAPFGPGTAHAQPAGDAPAEEGDAQRLDEEARLNFESARLAFIRGDYETALTGFRRAYELSQRSGLLYNIAQALDRLRRDEETVQALRDYLEARPDAPNRPEVEARIGVLEREIAEEQARQAQQQQTEQALADQSAQQSTVVEPVDEGGAGLHPAIFFSVAGLAVVGGALTVVFGLMANDKNSAFEEAAMMPGATQQSVRPLYDDASTFQLLTNISWISAAALGAGAVVLALFTDWDSLFGGGGTAAADPEPTALRLEPLLFAGPQELVLGAQARF